MLILVFEYLDPGDVAQILTKGLVASIRWYCGYLFRSLGGAGK